MHFFVINLDRIRKSPVDDAKASKQLDHSVWLWGGKYFDYHYDYVIMKKIL